jgi:serine/threonine-protein kinase RsbW
MEERRMPNTPRLTLTLPSDLRMLSVARAFVEAVGLASGLDKATIHAVVLVTGEAVSNIVRHAHPGRPEAQLQIQCVLQADAFEICFLDEGDPFDIAAVPHLDPAELRVGGRGVFLMRALMDELSCHRRGECGNVLRMVKRRPTEESRRECG